VVVEVGPAGEERRRGVKFVEDGRENDSGSVDVIRGSPVLSSTSVASSPLRAPEGLAQRIAAMHIIRARHFEERWAPNNAVDLGDRRQPDDPPGSRSVEGEIENTRLSIFSPQDDCCGHTPRPRSFVMVLDHRKKEKGFFGWLRKACHRASMFVRRG
jgi:hypothetical protein